MAGRRGEVHVARLLAGTPGHGCHERGRSLQVELSERKGQPGQIHKDLKTKVPVKLGKNVWRHTHTKNVTTATEFFLLGLSEDPELQRVLFALFLSMYLFTVLGNLLIILAITSDPHLQIPMYFFLSNLSLIDIGFTSTTVPKLLMNLQSHSRSISYGGCLTQMSFFITFACTDSMLLTAMAYDSFVAICHPLHYSCIMNPRLCVSLFWVSFTLGLLESLLHNLIVLQLTCFRTVDIANFFCHPSQLLHLACTDSFSNEIVMCVIGILLGVLPASGILFSYCQILSSILKIPSAGGKYKAFSTCGSHLSIVSLFYGTGLGEYFGSALSTSPRNHVVASVMYAVVTPLLNPFIYSLRNRDISRALERFDTRAFSVFAPAASRWLQPGQDSPESNRQPTPQSQK
ncbi:olfactory receptor 7E178-like [Thomomys bottae]